MRKKLKTTIKEYYDDNLVCFDIPFLTAILEHCKTASLSTEDLNSLIKKIVTHGSETSALTMHDYDYIIAK